MIKSLTPKSRFQGTQESKLHQDLVDQYWFHEALTTALAQMQMEMPSSENPAKSWDCHCQMVGAKRLIDTLLNLSEVAKEKPPLRSQNLVP